MNNLKLKTTKQAFPMHNTFKTGIREIYYNLGDNNKTFVDKQMKPPKGNHFFIDVGGHFDMCKIY